MKFSFTLFLSEIPFGFVGPFFSEIFFSPYPYSLFFHPPFSILLKDPKISLIFRSDIPSAGKFLLCFFYILSLSVGLSFIFLISPEALADL